MNWVIIDFSMGWLMFVINRKYKDYVYVNVSTGVLDKNKQHYLRCKDKAEKSYDVII